MCKKNRAKKKIKNNKSLLAKIEPAEEKNINRNIKNR